MTILLGTLTFLLVSFGVSTAVGSLIAFGMGTDDKNQEK